MEIEYLIQYHEGGHENDVEALVDWRFISA